MPKKYGTTDVKVNITEEVVGDIARAGLINALKNMGGVNNFVNAYKNHSQDIVHAMAQSWYKSVFESFTREKNNGDTNRLASAYIIRSIASRSYRNIPKAIKKIAGPYISQYVGGSANENYKYFRQDPIHDSDSFNLIITGSVTKPVREPGQQVSFRINVDITGIFNSYELKSYTAKDVSRTNTVKNSYANAGYNEQRFLSAINQYSLLVPTLVNNVLEPITANICEGIIDLKPVKSSSNSLVSKAQNKPKVFKPSKIKKQNSKNSAAIDAVKKSRR